MASHFKTSDNDDRTAVSKRAGAHSASNASQHVYTGGHFNGGDESYHAPRGNAPSSAAAPGRVSMGYVPATGASDPKAYKRRGRNSQFVETDPYDLKGRRDKNPKKRRGRIISTILFVVGIALIAIAGGMWLYNQYQYHEQDEINEELAAYATISDDGETAPVVDWEGLKAINSDVVGWIQIAGTTVNFPVYQGSDNDEYLHTNAEGKYSLGGQVFLDYQNATPGMQDAQTIIYGHHLRNGAMFKPVADMDTQSVFDSVTTVWYVTETATYELQPLLVYKTDGDDTTVRQFSFSTDEDWRNYLEVLLGKAVSKSSTASDDIQSISHVLTLCTCNYSGDTTGRTLLLCVPKSEAQATQ
jgi:sortase B